MNATVIGENFDLSERQKELIEEKLLKKLDKHLKTFAEDLKNPTIKAERVERQDAFKISFDMWLPGKKQIFAEESHKEFVSAVVDLREQLERQIRDYKDQLQPKGK